MVSTAKTETPTAPSLATAIHDPEGAYRNEFAVAMPELRALFSFVACHITDESLGVWRETLTALQVPFASAPANQDHIGNHRYRSLSLCPTDRSCLYSDPDHILRWFRDAPRELGTIVANTQYDCLIVGRTPAEFARTPQRLQQPERLVNSIFQVSTGTDADLMMACRQLSPDALQLILKASREQTLGNDVEWPMLCHLAGLTVGGTSADGLRYETVETWLQDQTDQLDLDVDAWLTRIHLLNQHIAALQRLRKKPV